MGKKIQLDDSLINVWLWDTEAEDIYDYQKAQLYCTNVHCFLLCVDINNEESVNTIKKIHEKLVEHTNSITQIVLVFTKFDIYKD